MLLGSSGGNGVVYLVEDNLIWLNARMVPLHYWITRKRCFIIGLNKEDNKVSDCGVSAAEFLIVEYQLQSFWLWSISYKVSDCGVSTMEYLTMEYRLQSIWLWSIRLRSISCEVSDYGVSAAEYLTVEYQLAEYRPSKWVWISTIEMYTENSRTKDWVKIRYEQRHWRTGAQHEKVNYELIYISGGRVVQGR